MKCHDPETGFHTLIDPSPGGDGISANMQKIYQEYAEKYDQILLQRLVDLNHQRAAEEAQGHIRYLRPEFQDPDHGKKTAQKQQAKLGLPSDTPAVPLPAEKLPWPKSTVARVATLKTLLQTLPPNPEILSPALKSNNTPKRRAEIQDLLDTLASLGQLH